MKQKQFEPLVYWTSKLSHNGITSYKQFEHCGRRMHKHSLLNLVQTVIPTDTRTLTKLNHAKPVHYVKKLAYYSGTRSFSSKKTGTHNFKIAFLTLTALPVPAQNSH